MVIWPEKTEQEHYESELKREHLEIETMPDKERDEVKEIFSAYGLDQQAQDLIVSQLSKNRDHWVEFMMKFELGLEKPDINRARNSAVTIGLSYCVGGMLPLSAYFFTSRPVDGLTVSAILTTICLFIFGFFKSKVTGQPPIKGAFKVTIIGVIAACAAFLIARLVS